MNQETKTNNKSNHEKDNYKDYLYFRKSLKQVPMV